MDCHTQSTRAIEIVVAPMVPKIQCPEKWFAKHIYEGLKQDQAEEPRNSRKEFHKTRYAVRTRVRAIFWPLYLCLIRSKGWGRIHSPFRYMYSLPVVVVVGGEGEVGEDLRCIRG